MSSEGVGMSWDDHKIAGKRKRTPEELVSWQRKYHIEHGFEWLTYDIANRYYKKASEAKTPTNEMVGRLLELRDELVHKYGITEIEAINILYGYHISEYVEKYHRICNLIPVKTDTKKAMKLFEDSESDSQ